VWAVTIPLFVVVASIALQPLRSNAAARVLYTWRWSLVALWFTGLVLLILVGGETVGYTSSVGWRRGRMLAGKWSAYTCSHGDVDSGILNSAREQ